MTDRQLKVNRPAGGGEHRIGPAAAETDAGTIVIPSRYRHGYRAPTGAPGRTQHVRRGLSSPATASDLRERVDWNVIVW